MNKRYFLILIMLIYGICNGQNLVPNPSFEVFSQCPDTFSQINFATGWSSYGNSPDFYNSCDTTDFCCSVPQTYFAYQTAATGNGYVGFYGYYKSSLNLREYLGAQLLTPLVVGTKYYVSVKANLPDSLNYAISKIGVKFSRISYTNSGLSYVIPNNSAHVYATSVISDTADWTKISGSFVADSAYPYVMIGNFFDDANIDTLRLDSYLHPVYNFDYAYYFFDDICVSTDSLVCNPIADTCFPMSLAFSITDATPGLNDGAVKINISGGQPPYLYSLDSITFQSNSTFTQLDTGTYQVFVTDSNGCSGQAAFMVTYGTTVSTQNISSLNYIRVFPNPFSDELFIEVEKETDINLKLIDVLGRVILASQHEKTSMVKLDVTRLPQGVYYLEVQNNKGEKLHTTSVQRKAG